jgi:hypothetical protein
MMSVDPDTVVLHVDTIISAWCGQEVESYCTAFSVSVRVHALRSDVFGHRNTQQLFSWPVERSADLFRVLVL